MVKYTAFVQSLAVWAYRVYLDCAAYSNFESAGINQLGFRSEKVITFIPPFYSLRYDFFMQELYIYGAGEFAQIAFFYFTEEGKYNFKGFIVDSDYYDASEKELHGFPVYRYSEVVQSLLSSEVSVFIAISASRMNLNRAAIYEKLKKAGCRFANYVSPQAFVSSHSKIGDNVFIFEENVIQNGVEIGDNTILWSGNHIGHQSKIGSHVFFSSHVVVSGFCSVASFCYFGVNSTLIDHLSIARGTLVGAGSLVLKDTVENSVYVGSPAKRIENKDPFEVIFK